MTIPSTESDGGWGQVWGTKSLPNTSTYHTGGGALIYDTPLKSGIFNGNQYLKGNG